jgi:AhpD family alkylhydroperoxidase
MRELEHYLNTQPGIDHTLRELVKLRASLLNGCGFCVEQHKAELQKAGVSAEKIAEVAAWRNSEAYTKRERAALSWTEAVTNIQESRAPEAVYEEMRAVFSEVETVNLTLVIAMINAWNRLSISLGVQVEDEVPSE